jgi:superfamily II DNA helicase RecQ
MHYTVFHIPALDPQQATAELNNFCSKHRVVTVDKEFVADGANSFWSFCVKWVDREGSAVKSGSRKSSVDYRKVLNDADFAVYAELRSLRNELAQQEGIVPYIVFTNGQLADMVRQRLTSKTELAKLKGVGQSRLDKYGEQILTRLQQLQNSGTADEADSH